MRQTETRLFCEILFEKIHSEVNKTVGNFLKPASLCQREGERTKEWVKKKAYKTLNTFTATNKMGHNNNNK